MMEMFEMNNSNKRSRVQSCTLRSDPTTRTIRTMQRGFTLIETMVALVLITVAMGPVFILATSSINVTSRIEHNLVASNLAQEGVEVIRNIRDTNWVTGATFGNNLPTGTWRVQWDTVGGGLMAIGSDPVLKNNNGLYSYSTGTDTIFRRTITIFKPSSKEIVVISSVTWVERGNINRTVSAESHLFDWR
ncbi:MAG: prepilin-type N-terminal cleavage/methylation domain-containing protein [Candidatus Yanofskybacteria bacterium]|nr:prepilin-type N-terminal cleavage/methylation domain-containing protein [Candidatus Yanofskybacteria bacterium]